MAVLVQRGRTGAVAADGCGDGVGRILMLTNLERAQRAMYWVSTQIGRAAGAEVEEIAFGEQAVREILDEAQRQADVDAIRIYGAMLDAFIAYRSFMDVAVPIGYRMCDATKPPGVKQ